MKRKMVSALLCATMVAGMVVVPAATAQAADKKLIAPVTPHPVAVQITVRMISFIAIGITPSEIMQRPIGNATLIFSFSCAV